MLRTTTLETIACRATGGRLVDTDLVFRYSRGPRAAIAERPPSGPVLPVAEVTVTMPRRGLDGPGRTGRQIVTVVMNAASGHVLRIGEGPDPWA